MYDIDLDFHRFFPNRDHELYPKQKEVIESVVERGNTLGILQTGGGKSLIYWMSALECGGTTVVVSPLTALISEQIQKIRDEGYEAIGFYGEISAKDQMKTLIDFADRKINPQFIFVSPEKAATDGLFEFCLKRRRDDIKLVVLDEVHCVSQWGLSFRPFYKRIPEFIQAVFGNQLAVKVLALTATLNPKELDDICEMFHIPAENIIRQDVIMRTDVQLITKRYYREDEKEEDFWHLLEMHAGEKTLVYVYRVKNKKRSVQDLCEKAIERGFKAEYFHGGMDADEKSDAVERFRNGETDIIFATNAFGMGIDIPDIRVVIHFMIPGSMEQYYQEIGRASRDHHGGIAYLLYSDKNIDIRQNWFIDKAFPDEKELKAAFSYLSSDKAGLCSLQYFENEDIQKCLPYFISCGAIDIVCKGFAGLQSLKDIHDLRLQELYDATPRKKFLSILKKVPEMTAPELSETVYAALVDGMVKTTKPLERWLYIYIHETELSAEQMITILEDIRMKKEYLTYLFDSFVYRIRSCDDSTSLHQEIALYLGMDKFQLNKIHKTLNGYYVRSKSEVIISNLLYEEHIDHQYEEPLYYGIEGKFILPDFTIHVNGKTYYWEHLGRMDLDGYRSANGSKLQIYNKYFSGQLLKTYENGALSESVKTIIEYLKSN